MRKSAQAIGAATLSILLVSSSALAFCSDVQTLEGDSGSAECSSDPDTVDPFGDFASMSVARTGDGLDYTYVVTTINSEFGAGGALVDETGSVVTGDRSDGSRGLCQQSFPETGGSLETVTFTCNDASAPVASIEVFTD